MLEFAFKLDRLRAILERGKVLGAILYALDLRCSSLRLRYSRLVAHGAWGRQTAGGGHACDGMCTRAVERGRPRMRGCRRPHRADKRRPTPDPRVRPGPGRVMPPPPPKAPCTRRKNRTRALQHAHRHPCGEHARAPKRQEPPGCDTHQRRRWHTGRLSGAGRTANRTPWAGPPQRLTTRFVSSHSNCNRKHGNCLQHRIPQNRPSADTFPTEHSPTKPD